MTLAGVRQLQRRRSIGNDFRAVWTSVLVSSMGDGMFITAFPLLAATLTTDPVLIAGVTIASRLPWLLFSLVTGAIADRTDRRRLMIGADMIRFVIVGALGVAIVADIINVWMLFACAFLLGTLETLHVNAGQAILPALVAPTDLLQANARFGSAQIAAAQFGGPPQGVVGSTLPPHCRSSPTPCRSPGRQHSSKVCPTCMQWIHPPPACATTSQRACGSCGAPQH